MSIIHVTHLQSLPQFRKISFCTKNQNHNKKQQKNLNKDNRVQATWWILKIQLWFKTAIQAMKKVSYIKKFDSMSFKMELCVSEGRW